MIEKLKPRELNDLIPLARVPHLTLLRAGKTVEKELKFIPDGNRIYYFAKQFDLEPVIVSKYWSTHMFMYELEWDLFEENVAIMKEYKVDGMSLLRDPWAFKYKPTSIIARFDRCRKEGRNVLKPWMIRCTEDILVRSLSITRENQKLLGESTIYDYISQRLGYTVEQTKIIVSRHPQVKNVRVGRVKS